MGAWAIRIPFLGAALLAAAWPGQEPQGLYPSSVVGTDFDFIEEGDPDAFDRLESRGVGFPQMPDKRGDAPLRKKAFLFVAHFKDGTSVLLSIDADFGTEAEARNEALRYTPRLGRLPTSLRMGVDRVVVHKGGEDTTAFADVGLIVLYSENATRRIGTHDLEETVFHESVHAAWDELHESSPAWLEAQKRDGRFITNYAAKKPDGEDLAESALFAYALTHHPKRIPSRDATRIRKAIPARIEFVARLLPKAKPLQYSVEPKDERIEELVREALEPVQATCKVDLSLPGMMSDILSNALTHGLEKPETEVRSFLNGSEKRYSTGDELLAATAAHFQLEEQALREQVQKFLHCNCKHGPGPQTCKVDLSRPGMMSDILSNALRRGLGKPEAEVRSFLDGSKKRYSTGDELLEATATHFQLEEQALREQVQKFLHCNCKHGELEESGEKKGR